MSAPGGMSATREAAQLSQMLRLVLGERRFPIDVEQLAYEVSRQQPDPIESIEKVAIDGFEGMLRQHPQRSGWHILYNRQPHYPGRERFTLAHEFGHYQLHRRALLTGAGAGRAAAEEAAYCCNPLDMDRWKAEEESREREADTFASHFAEGHRGCRSRADCEPRTRMLRAPSNRR